MPFMSSAPRPKIAPFATVRRERVGGPVLLLDGDDVGVTEDQQRLGRGGALDPRDQVDVVLLGRREAAEATPPKPVQLCPRCFTAVPASGICDYCD